MQREEASAALACGKWTRRRAPPSPPACLPGCGCHHAGWSGMAQWPLRSTPHRPGPAQHRRHPRSLAGMPRKMDYFSALPDVAGCGGDAGDVAARDDTRCAAPSLADIANKEKGRPFLFFKWSSIDFFGPFVSCSNILHALSVKTKASTPKTLHSA